MYRCSNSQKALLIAQAAGDWGDGRAVEPLLELIEDKDRKED